MIRKFLPILAFVVWCAVLSAFTPPGDIHLKISSTDTTQPVTFVAKDHKSKSTQSTSGVITFTTALENDYYLADSPHQTFNFYIETRLAKLLNAPVKITHLNISIVIDRSGSMQGVKMGYAKKAAKSIIDHLETTDYVSIVMYDNSIDSVQEPTLAFNKELIKNKIDKITPRGSTNLWGGTERGYEYVQKNYKPGYINRVLLISDGLANVGITDSIKIRNNVQKFKDVHGITLSTFGVGLDYNETLMTDMAETGAGNYYFIDAPEKMIGILDKELNGMLNIVARSAELIIRLPKGVKIEFCYPLRYTQNGEVVTIRMLDLFAEEIKATMIQFRSDDKLNNPLKFITTLSYTDIMDDQVKTVTNSNLIAPVKNKETYLTHFNKTVIEQTILFTANQNMEKALLRADVGDYDSAASMIHANQRFFNVNSFYVKNSPELIKMDSTQAKYLARISMVKKMNVDSVKKMQKTSKADSYLLRNKKQ